MTTLGDTKWQWTWRKDAEALAAFKVRQSAKGQKGGKGNTREAQAAKGMAIKAIAEELGVHRNTVSLWLKSES